MNFFEALFLGIIEGLTEFLPVSSTGHLILASSVLGISQTDFVKTFEVVIQFGAVCAIIVLYWKRLLSDWETNRKIFVAFLPTAIIGFFLYSIVKNLFFNNNLIIIMSLGGVGVLFILIEYFYKKMQKVDKRRPISYWEAFFIGLFQSLAIIPGVSRSGATIMGGLLLRKERKEVVEFSFLLAVPTILSATVFDVYKNGDVINLTTAPALVVGFLTSFVVALFVIRWLIRFVQTNTFVWFGVYRIVITLLFLLFFL